MPTTERRGSVFSLLVFAGLFFDDGNMRRLKNNILSYINRHNGYLRELSHIFTRLEIVLASVVTDELYAHIMNYERYLDSEFKNKYLIKQSIHFYDNIIKRILH